MLSLLDHLFEIVEVNVLEDGLSQPEGRRDLTTLCEVIYQDDTCNLYSVILWCTEVPEPYKTLIYDDGEYILVSSEVIQAPQ